MNGTTMKRLQWIGACAAVIGLAAGCQVIGGFEDFSASGGAAPGSGGAAGEDGAAGTAGSAGSAGLAGEGGGQPACDTDAPPATKGAAMVRVQSLKGKCFWIDVTEASRDDYDDFLADAPSTMESPCQWATSHAPACVPPVDPDGGAVPAAPGEHPVVCVNWCSALAYCKWAGKTLCRGSYLKAASPQDSDWMSVCSNSGTTTYPYGSEYQSTVCNGDGFPKTSCPDCTTFPASGQTSCASNAGVLNLSGNVAEWVDECSNTSGEADDCRVRGGSYASDAQKLECGSLASYQRSAAVPYVGFRCCLYD